MTAWYIPQNAFDEKSKNPQENAQEYYLET